MPADEQLPAKPADGTLLGRPTVTSVAEMADVLADAKRMIHGALTLEPGQRALDVGCGVGVDVAEMAAQVGGNGRVAGVDTDPAVLAEARIRTAGFGDRVDLRVADGSDLPFGDATFDASRAERVLQHARWPERVIAEMLRVTKPGGTIVVVDPDHGMWALDMADRELTRTLLTWWFDHIANPWIGRRHPGLLRTAGAADVQVRVMPLVFAELPAADVLTGITMAARAAAAEGVIGPAQADAWEDELRAREAEGGFLMYGALAMVRGTKKAG